MVCNFKIFRISFSRNVINTLPATSVDSKISRTLEVMMALKASSFHFLFQYNFIQKISNFWNMIIIIVFFSDFIFRVNLLRNGHSQIYGFL